MDEVQVVHGSEHLLEQQLGLVLIVAAVVLEARLQVPAGDELHHEVYAG